MYNKISLNGVEYYLVPVGGFKKEPVEEKEETPNLLDDFKSEIPQSVTTSGEIPQAQGKPSEYRSRFVEQKLTGNDVNSENTANLSSLIGRKSATGADGKEESFSEVSM